MADRISIAWTLVAGAAMIALIYVSNRAGGNHWPFFGTPLDQAMQRLGNIFVVLVMVPGLIAAAVSRRLRTLVGPLLLTPVALFFVVVATD